MLIALAIEAAFGWPQALFVRIGHPVTWAGRLIDRLDRALNREGDSMRRRRVAGIMTVGIVLACTATPALLIQAGLPDGWAGTLLGGILAWPLIAARSMYIHVADVAAPLGRGDLPEARRAVSMIVGRATERLAPHEVSRAALESLAENTSDGIVAPVFWGAIAGLPGIVAYKAINTMDSVIGHRTPRHEAFGWAAARLDDVINLVPARLTGMIFALVSGRPVASLKVMWRDARHHRSPNAGWPEAAMAAALGVRLSGPRVYGDRIADEPWLNAGAADPGTDALRNGLALYFRAMLLMALALALIVIL